MLTNSPPPSGKPSAKVFSRRCPTLNAPGVCCCTSGRSTGASTPTDYQHWVQNDAEAIGDLLLTIVNALGDALTSYHLMTGSDFEGDRDPCGAYLEEAQRVEKSRRIDDCIDTVRKMICQSRTLSTAERDAFLERLNNGITTTRDEDIMPVLEEFTKEVKSSIDRRAE